MRRGKCPTWRLLATAVAIALCLTSSPSARADGEAWQDGKAYTAMLAEAAVAAGAAVAAAEAAVKAAAADLASAKAAAAAAGAVAETTAETLAALEAAEAALARATATVAAAETAAAYAAAIAAAATAGTLIGQGLRGLWSLCFDPVCDATFMDPFDVYSPAVEDDLNRLIPELIRLTTGLNLTKADFLAAGDAGVLAWQFMYQGSHMFIGVARAAAAATAGRYEEVLEVAVPQLQEELNRFPATIVHFADVLETASLKSPVADLRQAEADFVAAVQRAKATLNPNAPGYSQAVEQLDAAAQALRSAVAKAGSVPYPPLVGLGGAFRDLTIERFSQFIADTAAKGEAALPPEEVVAANRLLAASRVYFPCSKSLGPALAKYDAEGDNTSEMALFGSSEVLNLAQLLRASATTLSSSGPWLNIDLQTSGLVRETNARLSGAVPEGVVIYIGDLTARPGQVVAVDVLLNEKVKDVAGAIIRIGFSGASPAGAPPLDVDPTGIKPGPRFSGALLSANADQPGQVAVAVAMTRPADGPGVLVTVPFRIPRGAPFNAKYVLNLTAELGDLGGNPISVTARSGSITVVLSLGDLDFDGKVTVRDATMALQFLVGLAPMTPEQASAMDVNGSGKLEIGDAIMIVRLAVGLAKIT